MDSAAFEFWKPLQAYVYEWFEFCTTGTALPVPPTVPGTSLEELMLAFHNTYWSGNCDGLARLLATNFTGHSVYAGVSDPPVNSSATIAACRADAMSNMFMVFMPEYPAAVAAKPDGGGVVELLGQVLAAVVDPVTNKHCAVKGV